jgi:glutamate-5-semialdehyde dehydrogenase
VPVFAHLEGICHIYVDKAADLDMAVRVVTNAKMRRTGVCGAAECLLIHRDVVKSHAPAIIAALREKGCEVRADETISAVAEATVPATACRLGPRIPRQHHRRQSRQPALMKPCST